VDPKKVLLVEDERATAENVKLMLELEGFAVDTAYDFKTAKEKLSKHHYPLVVLDLLLPDGNGIDLLPLINPERTKVVVLTGHGTIETAVEALKRGAADFLQKPISVKELVKRLKKAAAELEAASASPAPGLAAEGLVGNSEFVRRLRELLPEVAASDKNVLLRGEEGVGKTFVGRLVHLLSPRRELPFEKLLVRGKKEREFELEKELFGCELPGKEKVGLLERCQGGTLMLVGVEDLPPRLQQKLADAIEKRSFTPVGSSRRVYFNARLISTTTSNLYEMARRGLFSEELLVKLNEVELEIPPLRERREDVLPLFEYFLEKFSSERGLPKPILSEEATEFLLSYPFPGNVTELKAAAERLVLIKAGQVVSAADLGLGGGSPKEEAKSSLFDISNWREAKKRFEKEFLKRKLLETGGDVKKVAKMINLDVSNVYRKIREYKLDEYLKK